MQMIALAICLNICVFTTHKACAQENVVIVLDDSGSMNTKMHNGSTRIDAAKRALASVLKQFHSESKLGLLLLNGARNKDHWAISLEPLSAAQAIKLVASLRADGGTPLGERMREGAEALLKLREKQFYGNYRLLIVSDGEAEDRKVLDAYLPDILSRGIIVDAIGVDMSRDHSLATRVHSYRRADDDAALEKALHEVFAERVDGGIAGSADDYQLLKALDDATAKEVLSFISKANNSPIVGIRSPEVWGQPATSVTGGPTIAALVVGMISCFFPLILVAMFFLLFANKARNRIRGRL